MASKNAKILFILALIFFFYYLTSSYTRPNFSSRKVVPSDIYNPVDTVNTNNNNNNNNKNNNENYSNKFEIEKDRSQLVVLGMHHSGTSILVHLLNEMGANTGGKDRLMMVGPFDFKFW